MDVIINDALRLAENFGYLSDGLGIDLHYAKKGKIIESNVTKSFLEFLLEAEKEDNLIGDFLPIMGKFGYIDSGVGIMFCSGHTDAINYMEMLIKINAYLTKDMDEKDKIDKNFLQKTYFPFIKNCRKTARNVMIFPKVRLNWDVGFMKNAVKDYEDFIEYLRK